MWNLKYGTNEPIHKTETANGKGEQTCGCQLGGRRRPVAAALFLFIRFIADKNKREKKRMRRTVREKIIQRTIFLGHHKMSKVREK